MAITPFMTYLALHRVEYEDQLVSLGDTEIPDSVAGVMDILGMKKSDLTKPSGIAAGVVVASGSEVSGLIKPGFKVYYHSSYAFKISDLWIVDARAVVAFEELETE